MEGLEEIIFLGLMFIGFISWIVSLVLAFAMMFFSVPPQAAKVVYLAVAIAIEVLLIFPLVVRRLHDLGKEDWIVYPYFAVIIISSLFDVFYPSNLVTIIYRVVIIGYVPLMIMAIFFKGQKGPNKFGEEPKREAKFLNQIFNIVEKKDNQPASMPIN